MYKHGRVLTSQCCGGSLDKNLRLSEADILILVAPQAYRCCENMRLLLRASPR